MKYFKIFLKMPRLKNHDKYSGIKNRVKINLLYNISLVFKKYKYNPEIYLNLFHHDKAYQS